MFMSAMVRILSPNENILTIARMKTFIICFIRHRNRHDLFYMTPPFCFVHLLTKISSLTLWRHVHNLPAKCMRNNRLSDSK